MSASLVGSEMCIRDRRPLSVCRRRPARRGAPASSSQTPGRGGPRRRIPVSYTHLTLPTICSV
eukprot:269482-Alexandrium_andersonii.AAC.1